MRRRFSPLLITILTATLAMGVIACGGNDDAAAPEDDAAVTEEEVSDEDAAMEDEAADEASSEEQEAKEETEEDSSMDAVAPPIVVFSATDYGFEGPASVPAGMTEVRLDNQGAELHHLELVKLEDGTTAEDFETFMAENAPGAMPENARLSGGPNGAMPGASVSSFVDLEPGLYGVRCTIPSPDGEPHTMKGMYSTFEVTDGGETMAAAPEADVSISGNDFSFAMPDEITAGSHVIDFKNDGAQPHEIVLVRLDEGATAEDFAGAFAPDAPPGPPPGAGVAGTVGIEPGDSQSFAADFEPGNYAFLCFLPDPETGAPHFALGMSSEFEVK